MHAKFPLRIKLVLAICLPLLAVYSVTLVVEYRRGKQEAIDQMKRWLTELTSRYATAVDGELSTVSQVARCAADYIRTCHPRDIAQLQHMLRANLDSNPRVFGSCIALEKGALSEDSPLCAPYVCRAANGRFRQIDIARDVPTFQRLDWYLLPKLLKHAAWTDPYFDEGAGNALMCTYSVPLMRDDQFIGVVTVDISLEHLRQDLAKIRPYGGYCMLVSQSGTIVSHPDDKLIMAESIFGLAQWYDVPELEEVGRQMIAEHSKPGVRPIPDYETGDPDWIVYAPVRSVGWSFATVIPEDKPMRAVYDWLHRQLRLLLGGLLLIVLCVLVVAAWITRPLERLAVAAHAVAGGDLTAQVAGISSRDEIGQFAATFNQMVRDLQENVEATIRETAARQAMEKELQVARQIQTSLLPTVRPPFPDHGEFSLNAENQPARFMAGDFYDYWLIQDDVLALVIADVVGKGVPAAMFMAVSRTTIRNFSSPDRSPAEILTLANNALAAENPEQMFVTVFYGHYNTRTGELVFANGGHNPPFLVRSDGRIEGLGTSTGPIVGVWEDAGFDDCRATLEPGDLLVLYTDGVTEAHNEAGEFLGDEGFRRILEQVRSQPVEELCESIVHEVDEFRRYEGQDDVTLLALRRTP